MFTKAVKYGSKLRAALYGPSGAGKTYSALRIATGIGGRIGVIDTERGTARKYSDQFAFDVCELQDFSIDSYIKAIDFAEKSGFNVLIIDSISHAWADLLTEVDRFAATKFRGNKWAAWSEGTPRQATFIDRLLSFNGHVIATMRSATEWQTETDGNKSKPVRIGLKPVQGKSVEYEFDVLVELSAEHIGNVIKDRSGKYQDKCIERPGEDFGREMAAWLADGEPPPAPVPTRTRTEEKSRTEVRPGSVSTRSAPPPVAARY